MPRTLKLLLIENVDNTGIVGDVVTVRKGFARNFLLPRNLATQPSEERVKELAGKRAEAQKQLAELRKHREALTAKLAGFELTMIRSCNDQGILYGAVVQQDICDELAKAGFAGIKQREVRLGQVIKRVDHYDVHVKFDTDLDAVIKLHVNADRKLDLEKRGDEPAAPAADAVAKPEGEASDAKGEAPKADGKPAGDKKPERKAGERPHGDKPRSDRPEGGFGGFGGGERRERPERPRRGDVIAKFDAASLEVTKGWGKAPAAGAAATAPATGGDTAKPPKGEKGDKPAKADKAPKAEKADKSEGKAKKGK